MEEQAHERAKERERMKKEAEELWVRGTLWAMHPEKGIGSRSGRSGGKYWIGKMA